MEAVATELASSSNKQLVREVCQDYALWAPELSGPPSPGAVLNGGHNHSLQLIESPEQQWVVRIATTELRDLRQREAEATAQRFAANAGIGPKLLLSDPQRGITVMEYIDGAKDHQSSAVELAMLFSEIHALPAQGERLFSPETLRQHRVIASADSELARLLERGESRIKNAMDCIEEASSLPPVFCHNDLLRANRISSKGRLYALDWEYAAPGDPLFDLAVCASELDNQSAEELLFQYLRRLPSTEEERRFKAQSLLYACIEACWLSAHKGNTRESAASRQRIAKLLSAESSS
ncbi:choline kinase family protein [Congregibacter brevis]|uniref:Choline kinase family protein n=1 Tax=Congregibacter brevis TaxID=3081201 RepID=A0ABZ0IHB5_9GAMM|nr:choline kinase family protein [Congregibacter sp. IMCC45268]